MLLSGYLGAGKTTLLGRWLADGDFNDAAIVVNDPADGGLDAHLLAAGRVRDRALIRSAAPDGLAHTLERLASDRAQGRVPAFERVIVETTGLDDPLPLLEALEGDASLGDSYPVHGVITAVDAVEAMSQLRRRPRSRVQAQVADAFVITKTDLAEASSADRLAREIARINPDAEILRPSAGDALGGEVWNAACCAPGRALRRVQARLREAPSSHDAGSLWVRFPHAVELSGFCVRLAAFLETHAENVLRVKGLVRVQGRRGPAVIQAVGGTLYPVRTLKEWPAGVAESALVVTAVGLDDDEIRVGVAGGAATGRSIPTR
jgi:G3E family GTPase